MKTVNATQFKAECLRLMDDVHHLKTQLIITKRGKPWVKLLPTDLHPPKPFLGGIPDVGQATGDLTEPIDVAWDAET